MKYRVQQIGKHVFYVQKRVFFMWRTLRDIDGHFLTFYSLKNAKDFILEDLQYRDSPVYHPVE